MTSRSPTAAGRPRSPPSSSSAPPPGSARSVVDGDDVWWSEARPSRGRPVGDRPPLGRRHASPTSCPRRGTPAPGCTSTAAARGRSSGGTLWFTEFSDQRLYRLDPGSDAPVAVTPEPAVPAGVRHADLRVDCPTALLAVRETHPAGDGAADVVNEIVRIAADGTTEVLVTGPDFVSDPRLAPDGVTLSWLQWDHPNMPWDAAQLVVRAADGTEHVIAGGPGESVVQPVWGEDLALWWFSDRTDFWSLYRKRPHEEAELVRRRRQRHRRPAVGVRPEPVRAAGRRPGRVRLRPRRRRPARRPRGGREHARARRAVQRRSGTLTAQGTAVVCVAGGPSSEPVVLRVDVDGGEPEILRPARDLGLDPAWFSRPEHVTFPTEDARHRHRRRARAGLPADQPGGHRARRRPAPADGRRARRPDLRRRRRCSTSTCSTGPRAASASPTSTTAARPATAAATATRCRAAGACVDLDDVVACARYLADAGRVDPARMAIRGGSAGGYTTLAALTHAAGRLHRRRQPLRRRRPRRAGRRDAQVRVPLPRRAGRAVAGGRATSTTSARRSTTSTRSTPRSRSSRATRTRSCRRTRPR